MDGDKVSVAIHVIEVSGQFNPQRARTGLSQKRIVADNLHPKGQRALGHFTADAAQAQNSQDLSRKFRPLKLLPLPLAGRHGSVGLRYFPGQAQEHSESKFRRRNGIAPGCVHHHDATLRGSRDIHIVRTHSCPPHYTQFRRSFDDFARHFRFRADEHGDNVFDHA